MTLEKWFFVGALKVDYGVLLLFVLSLAVFVLTAPLVRQKFRSHCTAFIITVGCISFVCANILSFRAINDDIWTISLNQNQSLMGLVNSSPNQWVRDSLPAYDCLSSYLSGKNIYLAKNAEVGIIYLYALADVKSVNLIDVSVGEIADSEMAKCGDFLVEEGGRISSYKYVEIPASGIKAFVAYP